MPAIPYTQPIPKWIENELDSRAKNEARMIKTTPFVILTSPAIVTKNTLTNDTIANGSIIGEYNGCVLANTTDVSKLYQTGESIIGYDLNGKAIKVEGETNRKISVPLIIDAQIEDGGENSVLKTAKLNIKVFSLKQLEMFEMFFLRPGMQLVLEYGNNSDLTTNTTLIQTNSFPKNNFDAFKKEFVEVYSPLDDKWVANKTKYKKKLEDTKGNYDVWTGKVQMYGFTVDTDGTYNINLEISAGNELASQLLSQAPKSEGKQTVKVVKDDYKSYIDKIAEDFDISLRETFKNKKEYEREFFNWGVDNKKTEDNVISKTPYISVRLALKIINALNISNDIISGKFNTDDVIPVSSTRCMMSSNENIIFPGTLLSITTKEKTKIVVANKEITDPKDPKKKTFEVINGKKSQINGYSFNLDESGNNIKTYKIPTDNTEIELPKYTGNLLNVFINYDTFLNFKNNSIQNSDLIFSMLSLIQMSMYGYSYLELATPDSAPVSNTGLTIIDRKLGRKIPKAAKPYRFKIGPINSLIHTFSFDFQMDDLMAGQTLYSSQLEITEANNKEFTSKQSENLRYPESVAASANMQMFPNADKFYSINPIEIEIQKQIIDKKRKNKAKEDSEASKLTQAEKDKIKKDKELEEKNTITTKSKTAEESIKTNSIKFKMNSKDSDNHTLIYTDEGLLKYYLVKEPEVDTVLVSGVDVTIAMDGISGFSTGDYFHIDGVPEVYNQNGYFQIISIQQGINAEGWLTTITAGWLRKQVI